MCNMSWTLHSSLEKDNTLNHLCVSPRMGCLLGITKNKLHSLLQCNEVPFFKDKETCIINVQS